MEKHGALRQSLHLSFFPSSEIGWKVPKYGNRNGGGCLDKKVPNGLCTRDFREEAVKLVTEEGISTYDASRSLDLPKSTSENWVRAEKKGVLGKASKNHRPLTDVALAQLKLVLSFIKVSIHTRT